MTHVHSFQSGTCPVEVTGKNFSKQQAGGSNHVLLCHLVVFTKEPGRKPILILSLRLDTMVGQCTEGYKA